MFTLNQIHDAFKKVKKGADFPKLVQNLKSIGMQRYENFVADGKTVFYGANQHRIGGRRNIRQFRFIQPVQLKN